MRPTPQGLDQIYTQRQTRAADSGSRSRARAHTLSKERKPLWMTDLRQRQTIQSRSRWGTENSCWPFPQPHAPGGFQPLLLSSIWAEPAPWGHGCFRSVSAPGAELPPGSQLHRDLGCCTMVRLFLIWGSPRVNVPICGPWWDIVAAGPGLPHNPPSNRGRKVARHSVFLQNPGTHPHPGNSWGLSPSALMTFS